MEKSGTNLTFTDTQIAYAHLSDSKLKRAYRVFKMLSNPTLVNTGKLLSKIALAIHFPIKPFVKSTFFDHFCGGETIQECAADINLLKQRDVYVDLNYSVESKQSEQDFDKTFSKIRGAIEFASRKNNVNVVCCKVTGLGRHATIEKLQKYNNLTPTEQKQFLRMTQRMDDICALGKELDVKIYWDAEESWVQREIDVLINALMKKYNTEKAIVFNTYQLYRNDKLEDLKNMIAHAKANGYTLGAKLVRGAYVEKEEKWANAHDVPSVIHATKQATDNDYNEGISVCLDNLDFLSVCIATHNEESCLYASQLIKQKQIICNHPHVSFAQLYGMGDFITFNLAKANYNASKYFPFGRVREVIPYLIRRADENTSVEGQTNRELEMLKIEKTRRNL